MKLFLRQAVLLAIATAISWWAFLWTPASSTLWPAPSAKAPDERGLAVSLMPLASPAPESKRIEAPTIVDEPSPPPSELGEPEADGEEALALPEPSEETPDVAESPPAAEAVDAPSADGRELTEVPSTPEATSAEARAAKDLMDDATLLAAASAELSGDVQRGFATILLASPEEQLEIARFFDEDLVLIPRSALDPEAASPRYFRIAAEGAARVEAVSGRAPLQGYRQYRDLFDYEYARLPAPLRELRRSVLAKNEIYLFAALIPAREWAVIIARRTEALERTGRDLNEVEHFVLRYVRSADLGFDLRVEAIAFTDGERSVEPSPKGS